MEKMPENQLSEEEKTTSNFFNKMEPVTDTNYDNTFGEYDITPYHDGGCCGEGPVKHVIAFGIDETTRIYENKDCCGNVLTEVRSRPYAKLGSVDIVMRKDLCCCSNNAEVWSVSTDGGPIAPKGETGTYNNPTDKELVKEIAQKLNAKKLERGNIGMLKLHEKNYERLLNISDMVDGLVAEKVGGVAPSSFIMERNAFPQKTYDVQNYREMDCCQPASDYGHSIVLEDDEIEVTKKWPGGVSISRRPYAQLGVVAYIEFNQENKIWHGVEIDAWRVVPKHGKEAELCKELADDLQKRKVARGNIEQLKKAEQISEVVGHLERTLLGLLGKQEVAL